MKSRQSLGEIRLLASEICFASEIFANAKVIGYKFNKREDDILPYKGCEIELLPDLFVGIAKKEQG